MTIQKVKLNQDGNFVTITFEDGSKGQSSITDGIRRQHTDILDEWIANGGVVEPFETAEEITVRETAEANQLILDELEALDKASLRGMREWIASQPSAPQTLKDREAQAVAKRGQLQ